MIGIFLIAAPTVSLAQEDASIDEKNNIEAQTAGLPLRLKAYFLLKLSDSVASPASREALIRQAYDFAKFAEASYPLYIGLPNLTTHYMRPREDVELDRDVIRLNAVERLTAINADGAVALLEEVVPEVGRVSACETVLLPDTGAYYSRIAKLSKTLFSRTRSGPQRKMAYLARLYGQAESSLQIPGLIELTLVLAADEAELHSMTISLSAVLGRVRDGDPAFTAATSTAELSNRIGALVRRLEEKQLPTDDFLSAYRGYLIANTGRRCRNLMFHDRTIGMLPGWAPIPAYNELIEGASKTNPRRTPKAALIRPEDIRLERYPSHAAPTESVLSTSAAMELRIAIGALSDEIGIATSQGERTEQMRNLLTRVERYLSEQQAASSPFVQLVEASYFYRKLLELADDGFLQEKIAENYTRQLVRLWDAENVGNAAFLHLRELVSRCWAQRDAESARTRIDHGVAIGSSGGSGQTSSLLSLLLKLRGSRECRESADKG